MSTDNNQPMREPEHQGPIWTHPYMLYIVLTVVIFAGMILIGWLALENGWIPSRSVH